MGQAATGVGDDIQGQSLVIIRGAGRLHHDGLDRLTPLLVGHADDGSVGDTRMGQQRVLHLCWIDVLPAGDDHVHPPVGHVEEAVVVDPAQVAHGGEAVVGSCVVQPPPRVR